MNRIETSRISTGSRGGGRALIEGSRCRVAPTERRSRTDRAELERTFLFTKPRTLAFDRRKTLRRLFAVAPVLVGAICGACKRTESPVAGLGQKPNVLVVTFDTTRVDHLSCYGYSKSQTPTIDALAARGLRYTRCYAPTPITLPSHASIMTGLYPFRHRLRDNGTGPLDPQAVTLAEVFDGAGYETGAVIAAYVLNSRYGLAQGFDHYDETIASEAHATGLHFAERPASIVTDAALSWLEGIDAKPYFLWVHYFDPHSPYAPPNVPRNSSEVELYDGEIAYADRELGRLLAGIRQRDDARDTETVIAVMADHGESLHDHGEWTHGLFVYDATIHVPLIVAFPGEDAVIDTVDVPVSLVDVYPSLCSWLGMKVPYEIDGRALPLNNSAQPGGWQRGVYFETHLPLITYGWSPLEGIVQGVWKHIEAPTPELYNLAADPMEATNLYTAEPVKVTDLTLALHELMNHSIDAPVLTDVQADENAQAQIKLQALGYVGSRPPIPAAGNSLADPKDLRDVHDRAIRAALHIEGRDWAKASEGLKAVLTADSNNRWGLSLLVKMLKQPDAFLHAAEAARWRLASPLPEDFATHLPAAVGFAAARAGQGAAVVDMLEGMVGIRPESGELRCALAAVLLQMGNTDGARAQFDAVLTDDPKNTMALTGMGDLAAMKQGFADAVRYYQAVVDAGDPNAETYAKLGQAHEQTQRASDAIAAYEKAIEADPVFAEARLTLADLLARLGRTPEAIAQYLEVVRLKPDMADAHYNLGLAYASQNQLVEAGRSFLRAVELKQDLGNAWINLGVVQLRQQELDAAAQSFSRAKGLESVAAEARYMLGVVAAQRGDIDETVRLYEEAIEIKPSHFGAVDELSNYYLLNGRVADAVRILRIGVEHLPDRVRLLERLARILATSPDDAVRNGADALSLATRARELRKTERADVLATLAAAQAETGDFTAAVATCERALSVATRAVDQATMQQLQQQLELYRAGRPFRSPK